MSLVFDGLRSGAAFDASTHSPAMKFLAWMVMEKILVVR
jgi:hypothetical protein